MPGKENISRCMWSTVQMPLKDPMVLLTKTLLMSLVKILSYKMILYEDFISVLTQAKNTWL